MADGKRGPPFGNKNATNNRRPWARAIEDALAKYKGGKVNALSLLADKIVKEAVEKCDWDAIHEIANRMDGKPRQQMELSGEDGDTIKLEFVTDAAQSARRKLAKMLAKAVMDGDDKET
jgi:hypothetical protein